ncbi:MAG: type II secretion system F family protein [Candidatus Moranbacteria bacterium]|nr:type II secretion system F family protein [Candidatus Moranbacteria bacterium]
MPQFAFVSKNSKGDVRRGELEGKDKRSIVEALRSEGFFVTAIEEKKEAKENKKASWIKIFSGVSLKDRMMFARHLGVMLSSGLSLPKSLRVISSQTKNKRFRRILVELENDIKTGTNLADSLEKYPIFDELSVNMIRVGEMGGNMEEVMALLADQLEKEHKLLSKVRGAMYYPSVIILVMIGVGIAMMTYVVPKLTTIFADIKTGLPWSTRMIIASSDYMANHQWMVLFGTLGLAIALIIFFKTSTGKKFSGLIFFNIPVIKSVVINVNNARFARIYSSLTKSGVSVVESLKIISRTLSNNAYQKAFRQIGEEVQKGKSLHEELTKYPRIFPVLTIQMVEVGEETGKTVEVLVNLANFYEDEIDQVTKNLSSIIEPVLMVIIGSAVGFFAISMILPMYSVMENM